jgi:hypothetical protein
MICIMARYGSLDDGLARGSITRAIGIAAMLRQAQRRSGHRSDWTLPNPGDYIVARR